MHQDIQIRSPRLPALHKYPLVSQWYDGLKPQVSIIIINYNRAELTIACLRSIWELTEGVKYEVIVLDNGSNDSDYTLLEGTSGPCRLIRLEANRYFGEGNNIAVEHAKGPFICLLNNDTIVAEGWLARLVAALSADPKIGAVGPKFIYPDGRLQEAGALVLPDGHVRQIGKGDRAGDLEYRNKRDVHYVSAACILMSRSLFLGVGGFDLIYEPAYYEDADLCFKVREQGRTVAYCPSATIIHHENASQREVSGIANIVERNRVTFLNRWRPRLNSPSTALRDPAVLDVRSRSAVKKVALYMTYGLMIGGGERFLLTLADHLSAEFDVGIWTAAPYSRTRLLNIGDLFELNLRDVRLLGTAEPDFVPDCDLFIAIGNELVPPVPAASSLAIYVCQFPFPTSEAYIHDRLHRLASYSRVVVYSEFVRSNYLQQLQAYGAPDMPVDVIWPPVGRQCDETGRAKLNRILNIGRFFPAGHCKRQDLLIEAFKLLIDTCSTHLELHLVGGVNFHPDHEAYLARCQELAQGLPVFFHLNADRTKVSQLLETSSVYWHGTGMESNEVSTPWELEHFGISICEAMNAGCIAMAPNRGGPREIIENGINGYLFEDAVELIELTRSVIHNRCPAAIEEMRRRAAAAGLRFTRAAFCCRWDQIIFELNDGSSENRQEDHQSRVPVRALRLEDPSLASAE